MEVSYSVVIEAYRNHDWPKLHIELPIVIGTVPLQAPNEKAPEPVFTDLPPAPPMYDSVIGIRKFR